MENGVYQVDIVAYQATKDQKSMCDDALLNPAQLTVDGDDSELALSLQPVKVGQLKGYLGFVNYFPGWSGSGLPDEDDAVAAEVVSTHKGVTDDFNGKKSSDSLMKGVEYPQELLAIIRHKVFAALRRLAPAKLEGRDKGNLVSLITSDIELLEVFYAHTISPIVIAVLTSAIMVCFIWMQAPSAGWLALTAYVVVGIVVPVIVGRAGSKPGLEFRNAFGDLNSFVLDSLRGVDETIQYGYGEQRAAELDERSRDLGRKQRVLNRIEMHQRSFSNLLILLFSLGMLFLMIGLYQQGEATFMQVLMATVAMMGSFGPVLALSNLANSLNQTLACGDRVLDLLDEAPAVEEVVGGGSPGLVRPFARAFLHDAPFLLLDEPTSNLDSLNEGIILKSLKEQQGERTVVLVTHRASTLGIADRTFEMNTGRVS